MKVVAINGSPRKGGNTAQCLEVMAKEFEREGIEFEVLQPGANVKPCMACYHCLNTGSLHCVQTGDMVNEIIDKCIEADGIVLASPVYHGGIAGSMKCVLDRRLAAATTSCTTRSALRCAPCAVRAVWRPTSSCWAPWTLWRC